MKNQASLPRFFRAVLLASSVVALPSAAQVAAPDDGQWTMPGKDHGGTRYSGLSRITIANAGQLKPVWTFSTGVLRGHEGQPLVVGNLMYVVTPFPNCDLGKLMRIHGNGGTAWWPTAA